jgi:hypothetical protein
VNTELPRYMEPFTCLLCREAGEALYPVKGERDPKMQVPYFVYYEPSNQGVLAPDTGRWPPQERATDGHACQDHFAKLSKAALDHRHNKNGSTPMVLPYSDALELWLFRSSREFRKYSKQHKYLIGWGPK